MPIFVTLVKSTAESAKGMVDLDKSYEEGKKISQQMGIKHIAAYGVLGPYDLMFIYEAPDEKVAITANVAQALKWGGQLETWTVVPIEEFAKLTAKLKG